MFIFEKSWLNFIPLSFLGFHVFVLLGADGTDWIVGSVVISFIIIYLYLLMFQLYTFSVGQNESI